MVVVLPEPAQATIWRFKSTVFTAFCWLVVKATRIPPVVWCINYIEDGRTYLRL